MLPDHMIRNWEKLMYAHSIVNAISRLPRSLSKPGLSRSRIGRVWAISEMMAIMNASVDSPLPTMNRMPQMVEYQLGSRLMTQSTAAKLTDRPQIRMLGALTRRARHDASGLAPLRSSRPDQ